MLLCQVLTFTICYILYYVEFLTPETMILLGSTKSKINKDKNDENVPHLENTELVSTHCKSSLFRTFID